MKKFLYIAAISVLLSACTADLEDKQVSIDGGSVSSKILNGSNGCVEGAIIVRFTPSVESRLAECATRSGATRTGVAGVDAVLNDVNGYAVEPVFVITDKNRAKMHEAGLHLWYEIKFDDNSDIDAVATRFAEVADVQTVQFAILETDGSLSVFPYSEERPATAKEAGIRTEKQYLPITIIEDGYVSKENLQKAGKDQDWLEETLCQYQVTRQGTLLLMVDQGEHVVLFRKEQP